MKKLLALILAIGMIFSLAACGGDKTGTDGEVKQESNELDYTNISEDDLINKFIKDQANITVDEFVNLVSTYSYATINDDLNLDENITDKAIRKLRDNKATFPKAEEYVETLLKSDSPQVRGYAFSQLSSFLSTSDSNLAMAKEALKTEKEPYVIKCAVVALENRAVEDPEIGKFLLDAAKNENASLRKTTIKYLCNRRDEKLEGAVDTIIELMNDPDAEVRKVAYEYSGELCDERVIAPITEMLKNEADVDFHYSGIKGLVKMWYDYPFYENTSEAAYRATMDYLKTPVGEDIPSREAVMSFNSKSDDKYEAWKQKAVYFNPDEIYEVMAGIIKNENLNWMTRSGACTTIAAHCTKEQFDALGKIVNGLTDGDASLIQNEYSNQAEE